VSSHQKFRFLCAIATSGCLTREEQRSLDEHLTTCVECRQLAHDYKSALNAAMLSLVSEFPEYTPDVPHHWSVEEAKRKFFRRLDEDSETEQRDNLYIARTVPRTALDATATGHNWRILPLSAPSLLPYAAGFAAILAIGVLGYRYGARQTSESPRIVVQQPAAGVPQSTISSDDNGLLRLQAQLKDRDEDIASLTGKMARQTAEVQQLKAADRSLESSAHDAEELNSRTASERDELNRKLIQAQSDLSAMQKDLDSLHQQRAEQSLHIAGLEFEIGRLPAMLKDRDETIEQQRELLSRDRDIRDLMGARDLYIAEVMDVGRDGETKKPFGRVFYTKGKSLIFYAYDLDQQPNLRDASTFQAWGRRGPDLAQAANLGIFYMDNDAHKRWVLKFNDSKSLEQIDAVFVTVEPKGGSKKPSGKQLLFAYLRVEPNHP
jgi:hypothetical protein